jgi:hypothetical protein
MRILQLVMTSELTLILFAQAQVELDHLMPYCLEKYYLKKKLWNTLYFFITILGIFIKFKQVVSF